MSHHPSGQSIRVSRNETDLMRSGRSKSSSWSQRLATCRRPLRPRLILLPRPLCPFASRVVGDCQNEGALPKQLSARLRRSKQSDLNRETKSLQVSDDPLGAARREHAADILDEDEPGAGLDDDAARRRPELARIVAAEPLSCEAVRLARDAANEAIHEATEASAVEGSHIRPDSCRSQKTLLHRCDQVRDGEGFPLHHNDGASAWNGELDGKVEPSASGAEADEVEAGLGT